MGLIFNPARDLRKRREYGPSTEWSLTAYLVGGIGHGDVYEKGAPYLDVRIERSTPFIEPRICIQSRLTPGGLGDYAPVRFIFFVSGPRKMQAEAYVVYPMSLPVARYLLAELMELPGEPVGALGPLHQHELAAERLAQTARGLLR